jgi:hypothetical protein
VRLLGILVLIFLSAATALSIGGCGGGSASGGETTRSGPSKKVFIKRADPICEAADKRQVKSRERILSEEPNIEATQAGQVRMLQAAFPPLQEELKELERLQAPAQGTAEVEAILRELKKDLEKAEQDPAAVVKGQWPFTEAETKAKKFGFNACAQPT